MGHLLVAPNLDKGYDVALVAVIAWALHQDHFEVTDPRCVQKLPFQTPLFGFGLLLLFHKPIQMGVDQIVGIPVDIPFSAV